MSKVLTKEERKDKSLAEYWVIRDTALDEYMAKLKGINDE